VNAGGGLLFNVDVRYVETFETSSRIICSNGEYLLHVVFRISCPPKQKDEGGEVIGSSESKAKQKQAPPDILQRDLPNKTSKAHLQSHHHHTSIKTHHTHQQTHPSPSQCSAPPSSAPHDASPSKLAPALPHPPSLATPCALLPSSHPASPLPRHHSPLCDAMLRHLDWDRRRLRDGFWIC